MIPEAMLEFNNVSLTYSGEAAPTIDNLSFSIKHGEFVCLIGPSGCGKSTIFRLVNKLLKPQCGEIYADGQSISDHKNYCGYMPQNDLLFPCLPFNGLEAMRASAGIVPICDASPVHFPCAAAIVALDTHIAHDFLLSHAETPRR